MGKVSIDGATLSVEGETKTNTRHAKVSRRITLPRDADMLSETAEARHADGILTVSIPRRVKAKKRELAIVAAASPASLEAVPEDTSAAPTAAPANETSPEAAADTEQ